MFQRLKEMVEACGGPTRAAASVTVRGKAFISRQNIESWLARGFPAAYNSASPEVRELCIVARREGLDVGPGELIEASKAYRQELKNGR